jgi:hypothetical protein
MCEYLEGQTLNKGWPTMLPMLQHLESNDIINQEVYNEKKKHFFNPIAQV